MAVIVRVTRTREDGTEEVVVEYRSSRPPTQADIQKAKVLDSWLGKHLNDIRDEFEQRGLLERDKGTLERWHALGTKLAEFVNDPDIVPVDDRLEDRYIWQAIGQRAPADLHPAKKRSSSKSIGTDRDHFRLCYLVATVQPEYEKAEKQGPWRAWVELLESKAISQDKRILDWLSAKFREVPQLQLRPLARVMRKWLRDMHPEVLDDSELQEYLEEIWGSFLEEQSQD